MEGGSHLYGTSAAKEVLRVDHPRTDVSNLVTIVSKLSRVVGPLPYMAEFHGANKWGARS